MPLPLLPLILGGAALAGSAVSAVSANRANRRTIASNKDLALKEFAHNREMFDLQNEYNHPANVMSRLQQAGLNPNLIYGSGQAVQASAPAPRYNRPVVEYRNQVPDIAQAVNVFAAQAANQMMLEKGQAEINAINANASLTKQKTLTESVMTGLKSVTSDRERVELDKAQRTLDSQVTVQEERAKQAAFQTQTLAKQVLMMDAKLATEKLKQINIAQGTTNAMMELEQRKADLYFKQNENQLREIGINSSDSAPLRLLVKLLNNAGALEWMKPKQ